MYCELLCVILNCNLHVQVHLPIGIGLLNLSISLWNPKLSMYKIYICIVNTPIKVSWAMVLFLLSLTFKCPHYQTIFIKEISLSKWYLYTLLNELCFRIAKWNKYAITSHLRLNPCCFSFNTFLLSNHWFLLLL